MDAFRDRVVLITGAASGIGRQFSLRLSALGARIAALDRNAEGLETLAVDLKGQPLANAVCDVTDTGAVRSAVKDLEARLGPTDLLIASAGLGRETPALGFLAEDVNDLIRVNLCGVVNCIDAVLPGMRRRRSGHLAVLSSLASYRGIPLLAGYSASKAGVNALLDSLRVELRPLGIAVTTLCPGWIRTPMTAPVGLPPRYMMDVDVAVERMLRALAARRSFLAFPARGAWQVRLLRYLPRRLADWLAYRHLCRAAKWTKK
jgi:NAD(P)-dependent dehydrogenase (short-subunit alcohol dehydrogenase family)